MSGRESFPKDTGADRREWFSSDTEHSTTSSHGSSKTQIRYRSAENLSHTGNINIIILEVVPQVMSKSPHFFDAPKWARSSISFFPRFR